MNKNAQRECILQSRKYSERDIPKGFISVITTSLWY